MRRRSDSIDHRWPKSVFGSGVEPDPRFTLANQRTLLAWIRTSLALVLAAAVVDAVPVDVSSVLRVGATAVLSVLGILAAAHGWRSWVASERALRHAQPLPSSGGQSLLLASGVGIIAVLVVCVAIGGA